jgi:hypothetical protein
MFYIIAILAAIFAMPAKADETLKLRTVQHPASNQTLQVSDANGHALSLYRLVGITFLADGTTGASQVFGTSDTVNGVGPVNGHQVVTFNDGSELWLTYTGQLSPGKRGGIFTVAGGKGRYAGAKGDGPWESHGTPLVAANSDTNSINYVDAVINIKK